VRAEHEVRHGLFEDERAVRKLVERGFVVELPARVGIDSLGVELPVDRVRAYLTRVQLGPDLREADVVLPPAQSARPVPGGERRRFVEEEELGEASGCNSGLRCQPRNSSLHAIQRLPL
jgi:hypothetical protein